MTESSTAYAGSYLSSSRIKSAGVRLCNQPLDRASPFCYIRVTKRWQIGCPRRRGTMLGEPGERLARHERERRRAGSQRGRRARGELDRPGHDAVAGPLSAPVELGLGVHRDRLLALRPGASGARADGALRGPVAQRAASAHRLQRGRELLPGPGVLADRALDGRDARARGRPGSCSRRCTRPRRCRCTGWREDRERARGVPRRALPEARRVARLPLPRARPVRRRPDRDLASLGVGHGQLAALGLRARPAHADRRRRARVQARRRHRRRSRRERPTNAEYDRYAYFVKLYRDCAYDGALHPRRRARS